MKKVGLAEGLIRYDSENGIANNRKFKITKRIIAYSLLLLTLVVSLITLLATRADTETTILRTPGIMFQEVGKNKISNLYNIEVVNKTNKEIPLRIEAEDKQVEVKMIGKPLQLHKQKVAEGSFFLIMPKSDIKSLKTKIKIHVYSGDKLIETVKTTFIGPVE
jgi:polyferredoxin